VEVIVQRSEAIEKLFREESAKLWRSLFLHTGDREVARDSVAEAFAQLLGRGEDVRDPKAWVWRASFRIARGQMTSQPVPVARPSAYEPPEPIADLVNALRAISATQRQALVLHYIADMSMADVARVLGTSRSAVGVHLFRGRRRLRELMEGQNDEP